MKYETRWLSKEDAEAFLQNMRWFAGMGRITTHIQDDNTVKVRATQAAWSNFVFYKKDNR